MLCVLSFMSTILIINYRISCFTQYLYYIAFGSILLLIVAVMVTTYRCCHRRERSLRYLNVALILIVFMLKVWAMIIVHSEIRAPNDAWDEVKVMKVERSYGWLLWVDFALLLVCIIVFKILI